MDSFLLEKGENTDIVYVGNGCEAHSSNLYIPAKSEITSRDDTLVRHVYFQQFNEDYQNLTKYSLIEDLGIKQLTDREIENLPDCLAALPVLRFNELKRRLVEIKRPLYIHSNVVAIIFLVGGVLLTLSLAYILWRIYRVCSRVKSLKPVIQLFNEKKGQVFNANALVTSRLHTLEAKLTSLLGSIAAIPGTELALPSTSHKPELPPRRDSLPMVELNVTQQTIQETVKDLDRESSKVRHYRKYLQRQAADTEGKPTGATEPDN